MTSNVQQNNIQNINLDYVDEFSPTNLIKDGKLNDAIITVNNKDYRVTFNNGTVDVSRSHRSLWGSFKGLFYSNKTATCAELKNKILPLLRQTAMAEHTKRTVQAMDARGMLGPDREIVHYGFSDNRNHGERGVTKLDNTLQENQRHKITTIDDYNACSGIMYDQNEGETKVFNAIELIKSGQFNFFSELEKSESVKPEMVQELKKNYPTDKLQRWGDFLHKNAGRADIIGKLYGYLTNRPDNINGLKKSGWAYEFARNPDAAMQKFVMKNLGFGSDIVAGDVKKLADLLKDYVMRIGSETSPIRRQTALENFKAEKFPNGIQVEPDREDKGSQESLHSLFNTVLNTAFFRQTSKLGLEFFRQEKTPVMFQLSDFSGKTNMSKIKVHEVHNGTASKFTIGVDAMGNASDKWWKKESLGNYAPNLYCAPITHSEIRHLARITSDESGNNKMKLAFVQGHFE